MLDARVLSVLVHCVAGCWMDVGRSGAAAIHVAADFDPIIATGTGTGAVRAAVRAATAVAASRYMRSRLWRWVVVLFCQCCSRFSTLRWWCC